MLDDPISRIEAALDAGPVGQFTTTRGTDAVYDFTPDDVRALLDRLKAAEGELETERMRLAACGVAALANTPKSAAAAREMLPEYRSASLDDVEHAVAEQMRLRSENERLRAENNWLRAGILKAIPPDGGGPSIAEQLLLVAEDAARYRWLRENTYGVAPEPTPTVPHIVHIDSSSSDWRSALDDAVDAAIKEETK